VISAPTSSGYASSAFRGNERFPDGIEYAFHYHGVHERHVGDDVERIEFPG
jgi:hypothetical protein